MALEEISVALASTCELVKTGTKVIPALSEFLRCSMENVLACMEYNATRGQDYMGRVKRLCQWACQKRKTTLEFDEVIACF